MIVRLGALAVAVLLSGVSTLPAVSQTALGAPGAPQPPRCASFAAADQLFDATVKDGLVPGGVLAIGSRSGLIHLHTFGRLGPGSEADLVRADTIYDLASVTKPVATAAVAMMLVDQGRLDLDAPVSRWFPALEGRDKGRILVRDLLTHSGGLAEWAPLYKEVPDKEALVRRAAELDLAYTPGSRSLYSDLGFILLGYILEQVTSLDLDAAADRFVFAPLEMNETSFHVTAHDRARVAPTGESRWRGRFMQGEVHDENAFRMGGVAGHAGLFSTATDLAHLTETLMGSGDWRGKPLVRAGTVSLFTRHAGVSDSGRTLGWRLAADDPGAGEGWSDAAYGHTGNTGTALWLDPARDVYVIVLTNRILAGGNGTAFASVRRQAIESVLKALRNAGESASKNQRRRHSGSAHSRCTVNQGRVVSLEADLRFDHALDKGGGLGCRGSGSASER